MTDPNTPLSDDDLSAAIDGQAGPDVVERLRTDPAAQARYRSLDAARSLVADDPIDPLDPAVVEQLVGQALAAADAPGAATEAGDATVTPFVAPSRSAGRRRGLPTWSVAAVVTLLVAIGLGLVWSGQRSDDGSSTAILAGAGDSSTEAMDDATTATAAAIETETPEDPSASGGTGADVSLVDLGEFATEVELRSSLRDGVPAEGDTVAEDVAPEPVEVQRCETQLATLLQGEGIGLDADRQAFAVVEGDPKLVYEFALTRPTDEATALISVVDPTTCDPLITFFR